MNQKVSYKIPLRQTEEVKCEVEAGEDDQLQFHWVFRSLFETLDIMESEVK